MKILPLEFPAVSDFSFTVGRELTSDDWKALVERMHALWSQHRSVAPGVTIFADGLEGGVDPEYDDYSVPLRMTRTAASGDVIAQIDVFGDGAVVDITAYVERTQVGTVQVDGTGFVGWTTETLGISEGDVTVSAYVVPVIFRIERVSGEIQRVQISEAGPAELSGSDIP